MIDSFTRIYSSIEDKNKFLKNIRFYSFLRLSIRIIVNIFLPFYLRVSNLFYKRCLKTSNNRNNPNIIVSLTTFPARIDRVWIIIECMLRQTHLPDKIVLWLSADQFNGLSSLPSSILNLMDRGLQIEFCEGDLRSHKKYYYTIKNYPDDILITIDDDLLYRSTLIADLLKLHRKYPDAICCDRALRITTEADEILPYLKWTDIDECEQPSFCFFQTSGGGTLYPPGAFSGEVLNKDVFMNYCKYADDVWLNCMSQLNHTKIIKTNTIVQWIPVFNKGNRSLTSINVDEGQNDKQLQEVRVYYKNALNRDIFANLFNCE